MPRLSLFKPTLHFGIRPPTARSGHCALVEKLVVVLSVFAIIFLPASSATSVPENCITSAQSWLLRAPDYSLRGHLGTHKIFPCFLCLSRFFARIQSSTVFNQFRSWIIPRGAASSRNSSPIMVFNLVSNSITSLGRHPMTISFLFSQEGLIGPYSRIYNLQAH